MSAEELLFLAFQYLRGKKCPYCKARALIPYSVRDEFDGKYLRILIKYYCLNCKTQGLYFIEKFRS